MSRGLVRCWACHEKGGRVQETMIQLPALAEDQVEVSMSHCGLCSSDVDALGKYSHLYTLPLVCGHEGVGEIVAIGKNVRHLKVGQRVGVGVYRSACLSCAFCTNGANHLCAVKQLMFTDGNSGAFAETVRIKAEFAIPIPAAISSEHAAPLLCAGVTVFAALRNHNVFGKRVGVLGVGGLGHLALQFALKMGCETVALSTSADKEEYCKGIGVHRFVNIMHEMEIKPLFTSLDYLLLTAAGDSLDYRALLGLLAPGGKLIVIGVSFKEQPISPVQLLVGQKSICGSTAGSTGDCLDMLRFAAVHNIRPVVEIFPFHRINEAVANINSNKVRFRAVMVHEANLKKDQQQQQQ